MVDNKTNSKPIDIYKKFSPNDFYQLHRCYFDGKAKVAAYLVKDEVVAKDIERYAVLSEEIDNGEYTLKCKDKDTLKVVLLSHPNKLAKAMKAQPITITKLKSSIRFLASLERDKQVQLSQTPKNKYLKGHLMAYSLVETEWKGAGKVTKLVGKIETLKRLRVKYAHELEIMKSMKEIIDEGTLRKKTAKLDAENSLNKRLDKLAGIDPELANELKNTLKKF